MREEHLRTAINSMLHTKKVLLITICALLGVLLVAAGALCTVAATSEKIFPHTELLGIPVGSLTREQATERLQKELPAALREAEIPLIPYDETAEKVDLTLPPESAIALRELGAEADIAGSVEAAYAAGRSGNFVTNGFSYLRRLFGTAALLPVLHTEPAALRSAAEQLAERLSAPCIDFSYRIEGERLFFTRPKDGRNVEAGALYEKLNGALESGSFAALACPYTVLPAQTRTAQDLLGELAGEAKNAGYDPKSKSIVSERVGVSFDPAEAQTLLDAAQPGTECEIPAEITQPKVTAAQLKEVLLRDVLGSYTTHVGGSAARRGNVKKSAAAFSGMVLNSGETFSYNEAVGKRSAANGYLAAPAYVKGETVDEIGGGICQTSSTLYMAALLANLEIVTRAAHRYVPAYVPKGMDATVSWGGPEFRFRNDTDYPLRIVSSYSDKNNLTITIYGTKLDENYVKITNEVLGSTPFAEVERDDPTLAPGARQTKQTPYTGYQVRTYRNLYSGEGKLISSKFEASSDYKSRDRITLIGPAPASLPVEELPVPVSPTEPTELDPANPTLPVVPEKPAIPPIDPVIPPEKPTPPPIDPTIPPLNPPVDPAVRAA